MRPRAECVAAFRAITSDVMVAESRLRVALVTRRHIDSKHACCCVR